MLKKLFPYVKGFGKYAILSMVMVIAEVVLEVFIPRMMSDIIDVGVANLDMAYVLKTGGRMVLMAMRGRAPIVPVYIKRREHWYQRLVMVIGERVDVAALCSSKRGVAGIEAAAASLRDKEEQLKIISEDN